MRLQCFWISIRDWFNIKNKELIFTNESKKSGNITVSDLKIAAECNIPSICNGDNEMTELDDQNTREAINRLAKKNDILIRVFYSKNDENKINITKEMLKEKRLYDFGNLNSDNTKQIWIYYNSYHFELITYYESKNKNITYTLSEYIGEEKEFDAEVIRKYNDKKKLVELKKQDDELKFKCTLIYAVNKENINNLASSNDPNTKLISFIKTLKLEEEYHITNPNINDIVEKLLILHAIDKSLKYIKNPKAEATPAPKAKATLVSEVETVPAAKASEATKATKAAKAVEAVEAAKTVEAVEAAKTEATVSKEEPPAPESEPKAESIKEQVISEKPSKQEQVEAIGEKPIKQTKPEKKVSSNIPNTIKTIYNESKIIDDNNDNFLNTIKSIGLITLGAGGIFLLL